VISRSLTTQAAVTQIIKMPVPRIIAVGDVHGDVERLINLLKKAKVINDRLEWVAGDVQVIMMGDYIDRGPQSFETLELIMHLKQVAGRNLTLLIGNHEAMFLAAFDWKGFDDTILGRRAYKKYIEHRNRFDEALLNDLKANGVIYEPHEKDDAFQKIVQNYEAQGKSLTGEQQDQLYADMDKNVVSDEAKQTMAYKAFSLCQFEALDKAIQAEDAEFRKLWLRLEVLKVVWAQNDKGAVFNELNMNFLDVFKDSRVMLNAKYKNRTIADYIKFLRENLTSFYHDKKSNVMFVHAGLPYQVLIHGLPGHSQENLETANHRLHREFKGFYPRAKFERILGEIHSAVKKRDVQMWMTFTEKSPLFACHPNNRDLEWNKLSVFREDSIKTKFGYDALVYGHAYHKAEGQLQHEAYKDKLRHQYNIDFGLTRAYDRKCPGHGGWLAVNDDDTVTINIMDDSDDVEAYTYDFKEKQEEKRV
jgi:hypothetical protein